MNPEPELPEPVVAEFKRLLCEVRNLATKSERERCKTVASTIVCDFMPRDMRYGDYIAYQIEHTAGQSEPPAPPEEPMTIAKMVEKWQVGAPVFGDRFGWLELKRDLRSLVDAQVRWDAETCVRLAEQAKGEDEPHCHACSDAILESAGLK